MSTREGLPQIHGAPLVPVSAEDFARARRNKIIKIVAPIIGGLLILVWITWRVSLTTDWETTFAAGRINMQQGDFAHAEQAFARVVRERPDNADAHHLRSQALVRLGRLPEARQELDRVIALGSPDAALHIERAKILGDSNDLDGAARDYSRAIELAPSAEAYAGRAEIEKRLGRIQEALADYGKAIQVGPIVDYYVQQAALLERTGDLHRALSSYDSAIALRPEVPVTYRARASLRERLGDRAGAQKDRKVADRIEKPIVNEPPPG